MICLLPCTQYWSSSVEPRPETSLFLSREIQEWEEERVLWERKIHLSLVMDHGAGVWPASWDRRSASITYVQVPGSVCSSGLQLPAGVQLTQLGGSSGEEVESLPHVGYCMQFPALTLGLTQCQTFQK